MSQFSIITDSCCDLPSKLAEELELCVLPLSFEMGGKTYFNYLDGHDISPEEFYKELRAGKVSVTSAVSMGAYMDAMKPILDAGGDILCLSFSSALSNTYNAAEMAALELSPQYPDRKILVSDTRCASLGQGLLLYLTAAERKKGKGVQEAYQWVEENKPRICHWFTVDDLGHLKRGGRISAATALFGSMLNIKPVMHVDNDGRLVPVSKARGRKASMEALVKAMEDTALNPSEQTVFISHGDCMKDAEALAAMIKNKMGVEAFVISHVGPVIGSHSGPGTLALFYKGSVR